LEAIELGGLGRHQLGPVEPRPVHAPAEPGRVLELLGVAGPVHQQLLGHAAAHHTGAADAQLLADRDPGPILAGATAGSHAARAGADREHVEVEVRHPPTLALASTKLNHSTPLTGAPS